MGKFTTGVTALRAVKVVAWRCFYWFMVVGFVRMAWTGDTLDNRLRTYAAVLASVCIVLEAFTIIHWVKARQMAVENVLAPNQEPEPVTPSLPIPLYTQPAVRPASTNDGDVANPEEQVVAEAEWLVQLALDRLDMGERGPDGGDGWDDLGGTGDLSDFWTVNDSAEDEDDVT